MTPSLTVAYLLFSIVLSLFQSGKMLVISRYMGQQAVGDSLGVSEMASPAAAPKAVGGHPMVPEMVNSEKSDYLLI